MSVTGEVRRGRLRYCGESEHPGISDPHTQHTSQQPGGGTEGETGVEGKQSNSDKERKTGETKKERTRKKDEGRK